MLDWLFEHVVALWMTGFKVLLIMMTFLPVALIVWRVFHALSSSVRRHSVDTHTEAPSEPLHAPQDVVFCGSGILDGVSLTVRPSHDGRSIRNASCSIEDVVVVRYTVTAVGSSTVLIVNRLVSACSDGIPLERCDDMLCRSIDPGYGTEMEEQFRLPDHLGLVTVDIG